MMERNNKKWKKNLIILSLIVFTLLISGDSIFAFTIDSCDYDDEPLLKKIPFTEDRFFWSCEVSGYTDLNCWTQIEQNNEILQVNPRYEKETGVGWINEWFEPNNNIMLVYFTDENIFLDTRYNASLWCADNDGSIVTYSQDIIPKLKNLDNISNYAIWMKDNATIFWAIFFFIVIIIFIIWIIYRWQR